ncbi:MAG: hypothetical protein CVV64_00500 [Candidatus Wallbacteria bacterium HGW-Wallbacteria-1]|uniref:Zinc-ribbon domain-containing protein n=1 Tax=Candidatus Wallbacteria bacterium HGW-Wallbacteria-1 TaxID=2013854 RepID=A0A2N1PUD5_9BACT|nr:MAG: hypothetical protein CVV64_00500 [Candidatus Wallbacteria bacterium HGW-Wallbacteria-1]
MKKNLIQGIIAVLLLLVATGSALALFCPKCGQSNNDTYSFCVKCGNALQEARTLIESEPRGSMDTDTGPSSRKSSSSSFRFDDSSKGESDVLQSAETDTPGTPLGRDDLLGSEEKSLLDRPELKTILNGGGMNGMSQPAMEELMNDPNMGQVYERYKDKGYQKKLLEGLKFINEDGENMEMNDSIRQLEGLFEMLNSAGGSEEGPGSDLLPGGEDLLDIMD